jgi:catechol-2,3-dioxygenase
MRPDTLPAIWLDHLNLPASDPEMLARWYADRLNLDVKGHIAYGPGISLFFHKGLPLKAGDAIHFGFRVETRSSVEAWADHLGVPVSFDEENFFAARVTDPDGNVFEIYWDEL